MIRSSREGAALGGGGSTLFSLEQVVTDWPHFGVVAGGGGCRLGDAPADSRGDCGDGDHPGAAGERATSARERAARGGVVSGADAAFFCARGAGGFALRSDTNKKLANYVGMIGFYDMPLDYLDTFQQQVENVTVASIKDAFKRRVNLQLLQTITVGKVTDKSVK